MDDDVPREPARPAARPRGTSQLASAPRITQDAGLTIVARPRNTRVGAQDSVVQNFTYGGGLLLEQVEVVPIYLGKVFLGSDVPGQLDAFLNLILGSASAPLLGYIAPLAQYSAGGHTISGFGHRLKSHTKALLDPLAYSADGKSLTANDIDRMLKMFADLPSSPVTDPIPKPNANTLYLIVVDGSARLTLQGGALTPVLESCFDFLGYHEWSFSMNAPFAVATYRCTRSAYPPDSDLPGNANTSVTATIAHELVEAITNPSAFNFATGWTGPLVGGGGTGEIADDCGSYANAGYPYGTNGPYVASYWSNQHQHCISPQSGKAL